MARDSSLRVGLLLRVGLGFLFLLLLDALFCYYMALHFSGVVYDHWLVDSTESLGKALRVDAGRIRLDLPEDALKVFRFDALDRTYFRVDSRRQGPVAGDTGLLAPAAEATLAVPRMADGAVAGQRVRAAISTMELADDVVTLEVAETLEKRGTLAREILVAMVTPQVVLLAVAMFLSWLGIVRGLRPLTDLATALQGRSHESLDPVPEEGVPAESLVLVERLNELLARVREVVDSQRRFVANAAHQLRTPLAAIYVHTDRALRATDENVRQDALVAAQGSARRASRAVQQLLALARAEPGGGARPEFYSFDLAAMAREVGMQWVAVAIERGVDFGLEVPEDEVMVVGHEGLLSELLGNLVDNALRYGRTGGAVTVSVSRMPDGSPLLMVEDDGPGVPAELRARVFERFFRIEGSAGEGCGLGLAIVSEIAQLHGAEARFLVPGNGVGAHVAVIFAGAKR